MNNDVFDYVIIGAGSAGCVLANRLSADGTTTVALLEAGGRDWNPWIHIPVGYFKTMHNPKTDWCYVTQPDPGLNGRSIKWPRGKVLGGSSSINGLLYVRGQRQDYDRWKEIGCEGWGYDDVLPYFRKAENQSRGGDEFHGSDGPLHVSDMSFKRPICDDFIQGVHSLGTPLNDDINGAEQEGVGYYQLTAHKGRRCSAAVAYLNKARTRTNLAIMTHAMVKRIKFKNKRAESVELSHRGQTLNLKTRCEIILAAGAIGSPQILQLSGVGPGELLQEHGIDVVKDAQDVGRNLQDHLQLRTVYKTTKPVTLNDELSSHFGKLRAGINYALNRNGPLSMAASQVYAFCKTRLSNERPDIQYHFQPLSADSPGEGLHKFSAITASVCQLRPQSRGHLKIASTNPADHPIITPNYLSTDLDCQTAVESIKFTRKVMQSAAMAEHVAEEMLPDPAAQSDDELLNQAREIANTIYHPTCTCRMGADSSAVVDLRLRVKGVEGLRVVDASIMPELVSGNTNAPTIMIAEKASELIIADREGFT
ncbi:choline dehydrogenase [Chromatiales bacterium (ex Bugula neritina AB1)]|nr:choline dehydrogenase [Chromatiales bacterium (ex Bugula neritina AB1)]